MKVALVIGATGVAGRAVVTHLSGLPDWEVIGASRRPAESNGRTDFIAVDLSDPGAAREGLAKAKRATHVFYAAYAHAPSWAEQCGPNTRLLVNAVDALESIAPDLQHICLLQGTKYYGSHLGPFRTPARETDPRHLPPNFYYNQQDFLEERQRGKKWTWSCARPHTICGYAVGTPLNLVTVLGVYATISKELGVPLRWPGKPGAFRSVYQATDAGLLARAMVWMATNPKCANEAFNVTNGDYLRFENLWPILGRHFDMEIAPPQQLDLVQFMSDKKPTWDRLVEKHRLAPIEYARLVDWGYANYAFSCDWDIMSSTHKCREFGFDEFQDSQDMFIRHLDTLADKKVIPRFKSAAA
jgi:nucleoside-diphosphate-sugar epimerase